MLRLEDKKKIVANVTQFMANAVSIVAADYTGLAAVQMTDLRNKARAANVQVLMVRNTLAKIALSGSVHEPLSEHLTGPMLLVSSNSEPAAAARLVRDFAKENKQLKAHAICVTGDIYSGAQIEAVASLPTKEEALARMLSVLQAPITKFVRTVAAPHTKMVRTVAAVRDKKEAEAA